ncbi:dolichyl-diphosphooligosaccharide--protein glycosyltransferase subunit Wbp1p [[Candida] railenensis]|uniref:Dolichyl-diphosphooligosaccharide--protein glycosyltransferase subunit WBP1 n=1 Tax=[Candida] railenensis TaxID=45579 RepID=A0A9P0QLI8_9ASCO|nr:dolichyl-diphosphooligosaccharide--protein glycosyltransferase subunit Wbp1p [[Candida] railenensis]
MTFGSRFSLIGLLITLFIASVHAFEALVVYDAAVSNLEKDVSLLNPEISKFLESNSLSAEFKTYTDETLELFFAGQKKYNHLILLPSSKKAMAKKSFNQHLLLDFISEEGNILVVGGSKSVLPEDIRSVLNEIGIYPSPKGYELIDYFNQESDKGVSGVQLKKENFVAPKVLPFKSSLGSYTGGAALISNNENILPLVRASSTSFSAPIEESDITITQDKTWTLGKQGFAAVGVQALNNARLAWVGSESLVDEELLKWNFKAKGVLKLQFTQHHKHDEPQFANNNTLYRIMDQVIYTVGVSELKEGKWTTYEVKDEDDQLQLSFKMLDPYQRLNLEPLGPASSSEEDSELDTFVYFTNFTLPDHHGMFTFELDYKRSGLSYLLDKRIVAVRHLANDEYKRSWEITNAWVYIASAAAVVLTWFLFVINFIYVGNIDYSKKNI